MACSSVDALHQETSSLITRPPYRQEDDIVDFEGAEQKLVRKLDARMSILVLIYILNYIDRANISVARLRGFEEDLHLENSQYASVLGIFFVGYLVSGVISNCFLQHFMKASIYLPVGVMIWGLLSLITGAATGFHEVLFLRFCLGLVEGTFFPGALLLLSHWYKQKELGQRTAYLACGLLIANATGSLMASGILELVDGGWRALFLVEGGLTILVAVCALFILPDFPEASSGWISSAERDLAIRRLEEESVKVEFVGTQTASGFWLAISDWKVWWLAFTLGVTAVSSSFHLYFPTLVETIGYSPTKTLILCVFPWLSATFVAIVLARHSDRCGERFWHISFSMGVGILGFILFISAMNPPIRYMSFFLMTSVHGGYVCFMAWVSGSVSDPPSKRPVALALVNTGGILASIFVPYAWPSQWGPDYTTSFIICIFASCLGIAMCWIFRLHLARLNANAKDREGLQQQNFRYLL